MSVLDTFQRSRVQCDACRKAWVFVDGIGNDIQPGLVDAGWGVHGGRHTCPRCVRKASATRRE
jgi:hypothetical protein